MCKWKRDSNAPAIRLQQHTLRFFPEVDQDGNRTHIIRRHDVGHEMLIIADGTASMVVHHDAAAVAAGLPREEEVTLKFGDYVDEHIMLLPTAGYLRRNTLYPATECTVALLTSTDLIQLRKERRQIDDFVRPYVTQAKRSRFLNKVDGVFMEIDTDQDGWITRQEFADKVKARRKRGDGGSDAEAFFHTILAGQPVNNAIIDNMFRDITLSTPEGMAQTNSVAAKKPVPLALLQKAKQGGLVEEKWAEGDTSVFLREVVDRDRFYTWWLADETHEADERADRRKIVERINRVYRAIQEMTVQMTELTEKLEK